MQDEEETTGAAPEPAPEPESPEEVSRVLDTVKSDLEEHQKKIEALHGSVSGLSEKESHELADEVHTIKEMLEGLKPLLVSIKELNEKLLDLNKKMLMR